MDIFYRISRLIFTLYAAVVFGISFLIVIPCYFFVFNFAGKTHASHVAHKVSRYWARWLYFFFFIRVKIRNKDLIDPDRTYVFVSNHRSFLDIPVFALSCKNTFRFLSKAELARVPVLNYIIKNLYITVDRSDRGDRSLSLKKMMQSLDENISVFLCPEGTRNQTNLPLLPFKDGAFRLAIESGTPMGVLTIFNSNKLLNPARWFSLAPGTIYATWHSPVETSGLNSSDLDMLKKNVADMMIRSIREFEQSGK